MSLGNPVNGMIERFGRGGSGQGGIGKGFKHAGNIKSCLYLVWRQGKTKALTPGTPFKT